MDKEIFKKQKGQKSPEDIIRLPKANADHMKEEEGAEYFAQLNKSGEISDEELDNVAGGGCHKKDGRLVVSMMYSCGQFICKSCGRPGEHKHHVGNIVTIYPSCELCKYCSYEKGLWICNNELNKK